MSFDKRDMTCGLLFVAIGLFFALKALIELPIGTPSAMGPGFFPVMLGAMLTAFGLAIAASALGKPAVAFAAIGWRGVTLISAAVLTFALAVQPLGMLPALILATFIAAYAPAQARFWPAAALSVGLTLFNILVFIVALRLPYPIIGETLRELVR